MYATIDVVAEKQVVCVWWLARILHESKEVVELAMNVCSNCQWAMQSQEHGLRFYDLLRLIQYFFYEFSTYFHEGARRQIFCTIKPMNYFVNVIFLWRLQFFFLIFNFWLIIFYYLTIISFYYLLFSRSILDSVHSIRNSFYSIRNSVHVTVL